MNLQKGFALGLALGFAFGLGCATAATVIPPARAQAGAQQWEYTMIDHNWDDGRWIGPAAEQGWEIVAVTRDGSNEHFSLRHSVP